MALDVVSESRNGPRPSLKCCCKLFGGLYTYRGTRNKEAKGEKGGRIDSRSLPAWGFADGYALTGRLSGFAVTGRSVETT